MIFAEMFGIVTIVGGVLLVTIISVILCAHFLQQIRDELREMNGKGKATKTAKTTGGYARR